MFTLLFLATVLTAIVWIVATVGIRGAAIEVGKALFFCAAVLILISMVVGVARGKQRA